MARDVVDLTPIESRDELVQWLASGCKTDEHFRLGTEHEKFPYYLQTLRPVPYEGRRGIRALLEGMQGLLGWEPIMEGDHPIGLLDVTGGGAISLEPGGQFELSGAPVETLHQTHVETIAHLAQLKEIAAPLRIGFLALGASPLWKLDETPMMPKARYRIMADYMPKVGTHGLDMMFRTSTVQVNLDFSSEADMVKKLRVGLALQPITAALFANSPFLDGRLNGFQSYRSEIWRDVDKARSGMIPFAFEDGMGFERYVDYALDVPMYFLKRGDTYHNVAGASFRDLLEGRFKPIPGERAYVSDWANHLGTIFPEVRLKRYLEMRGADVGPLPIITAFSAFWTGLYYHQPALDAAWDIVKSWNAEERQALRDAVPKLGLKATIHNRSALEIARELTRLARDGLAARARLNPLGQDETIYLEPIEALLDKGETQADELIALYEGAWQGSVEPVFEARSY